MQSSQLNQSSIFSQDSEVIGGQSVQQDNNQQKNDMAADQNSKQNPSKNIIQPSTQKVKDKVQLYQKYPFLGVAQLNNTQEYSQFFQQSNTMALETKNQRQIFESSSSKEQDQSIKFKTGNQKSRNYKDEPVQSQNVSVRLEKQGSFTIFLNQVGISFVEQLDKQAELQRKKLEAQQKRQKQLKDLKRKQKQILKKKQKLKEQYYHSSDLPQYVNGIDREYEPLHSKARKGNYHKKQNHEKWQNRQQHYFFGKNKRFEDEDEDQEEQASNHRISQRIDKRLSTQDKGISAKQKLLAKIVRREVITNLQMKILRQELGLTLVPTSASEQMPLKKRKVPDERFPYFEKSSQLQNINKGRVISSRFKAENLLKVNQQPQHSIEDNLVQKKIHKDLKTRKDIHQKIKSENEIKQKRKRKCQQPLLNMASKQTKKLSYRNMGRMIAQYQKDLLQFSKYSLGYYKYCWSKNAEIYCAYDTSIIVSNQDFSSVEADAVLLPYAQIMLQSQGQCSKLLKYFYEHLAYDLIKTLKQTNNKNKLKDGALSKIQCKGVRNFYALYAVKMSTSSIDSYAQKIFSQGIYKAVESIAKSIIVNGDHADKTIAILGSFFPGINRKETPRKLMSTLMNSLMRINKQYKSHPKARPSSIIVIVSKADQFQEYLKEMRELMCDYIKIMRM